jgi:hypothetical protein
MKTNILTFILLFVLTFSLSHKASAQLDNVKKTTFSLEIDPATFAFGGYSAHLRIQPKSCDHLLFGAGIYAMDMPDVFVDFNDENKDKGWKVRINKGIGLFAEHHFSEVNKKWFVGAQTSIQEFKIEKDFTEGSEKFSNFLVMAYGGYTLKPFKANIYFKPWAGVGYTAKIAGDNSLGGNEYNIAPISMFATLHIGYTF